MISQKFNISEICSLGSSLLYLVVCISARPSFSTSFTPFGLASLLASHEAILGVHVQLQDLQILQLFLHHKVLAGYLLLKMSAASISTAMSGTELSVRSRQEDEDVVLDGEGDNDILAASRLADSTVPDGGMGWVVIAACGVVTFWFVGTCASHNKIVPVGVLV